MATYLDDKLFARLNHLLGLPTNSEGWDAERKEWESPSDHWSEGWDKFFQFLWQLQCFEYLNAGGRSVTFLKSKSVAAPDFKVTNPDGECFYAEAYVYSKWWFAEIFLEELVRKIDSKLGIMRVHNIRNDSTNSFFSEGGRTDTLEFFAQNLTPEKLEAARANATEKSPYVICERAGIKLVLEGDGEYQPDESNAQGDPSCSRKVFVKEIICAKKNENDLQNHRPNMLLANGLGLDFQTTFFNDPPENETLSDYENTDYIDCLLIAACGINDSLKECRRIQRIPSQRLG